MRILGIKIHREDEKIDRSIRAFQELGHEGKVFDKIYKESGIEGFMKDLFIEIDLFHPDFVFVSNYLGLLSRILNEKKIPVVSWFVDNPFYWLEKEDVSPYCYLFVVERLFIKQLKEIGFEHVFYLPNATDPSIFDNVVLRKEDEERYKCNISFVGGSVYYNPLYKGLMKRKIQDPDLQKIIEESMRIQAQNPLLEISSILDEVQEAFNYSIPFDNIEKRKELEMYLEEAASAIYRKEMIEMVQDLGFCLYGDAGWRSLLSEGVDYRGRIDYRNELPKLYKASKINLNMTKSHARTGLSKRPFDICCSGAFMLTDYRHDLGILFDPEREIVWYRDKWELREKAIYYLDHPFERMEIAQRAKERVLREHTYRKRMGELIDIISKALV